MLIHGVLLALVGVHDVQIYIKLGFKEIIHTGTTTEGFPE